MRRRASWVPLIFNPRGQHRGSISAVRTFSSVAPEPQAGGSWGGTAAVASVMGLGAVGAYLYFNPAQRELLMTKATTLWQKPSIPSMEKVEKQDIPPGEPVMEGSKEGPEIMEERQEENQASTGQQEEQQNENQDLFNYGSNRYEQPHRQETVVEEEEMHKPEQLNVDSSEQAKHHEESVQDQRHHENPPVIEAPSLIETKAVQDLEPDDKSEEPDHQPASSNNVAFESPSTAPPQPEVQVSKGDAQPDVQPTKEEPRPQPAPASPDLFRDIYTMQKEAYEKALAEKDAKLKRKLEKQRALLVQQHERELEHLKQEQQRDYEHQEQLLLERYQKQIAQLQQERQRIVEEAQSLVETERKKLAEKRQALVEKLKELHASRLAISQELQSKMQTQKQEHLALSKSNISAHTIFLALVELSTALEQHSQPFTAQLSRLREAAKGEQVIEAAAGSISGLAEKGVYSYDRLKLRFHQLQKHAYRAALVPPNAGMWWHALSVVFAATSLPPSLLHVQGEQTVEVLGRASQLLDGGQLKEAITEVEKLQGLPKEMAKDWLKVAKDRLLLEQALRTVTAELEVMIPSEGNF